MTDSCSLRRASDHKRQSFPSFEFKSGKFSPNLRCNRCFGDGLNDVVSGVSSLAIYYSIASSRCRVLKTASQFCNSVNNERALPLRVCLACSSDSCSMYSRISTGKGGCDGASIGAWTGLRPISILMTGGFFASAKNPPIAADSIKITHRENKVKSIDYQKPRSRT